MKKIIARLSITARLIVIYTCASFLVLLVSSLALYLMFAARLEKDKYQFLENNIAILQKLLKENPHDHSFLKNEIITEPAIYHYYVRILDKSGNTAIETPHMSENFPKNIFSQGKKDLEITDKDNHIKHKTRKYLLLVSKDSREFDTVIQMAQDVTAEQDIIDDYRKILLMVLSLSMISSIILGFIITGRGLKPLKSLTQSASNVTLEQLNQRVNASFWPKELSQLAESYNKMLDRIEVGVERLSQFSADLAHELRTPINNLMGEAELALAKPRNQAEYETVIASSLDELQRIAKLIDNLLFLARTEHPNHHLTLQYTKLHELLDDVCNYYGPSAEEKSIQMSNNGESDVYVDHFMLRTAIGNLVSNAIKYTQPQGKIELSIIRKNEATQIIVCDNGDGIEPHHLPFIFNRFYRTDKARSRETGGNGLGLAITKQIIELHQGKIVIESAQNTGTIVTITLPHLQIPE